MTFIKRLFVILLAALMLIGIAPLQVFADIETEAKEPEETEEEYREKYDKKQSDVSFSLKEKLQSSAASSAPQNPAESYISGAEMKNGKAAVTYCTLGNALIEVTLYNETDEAVLARGSLTVCGNGEETEAEITVSPENGKSLPESYILKAVLTPPEDDNKESITFVNTDSTRREKGIKKLGLGFFSYLPADHRWETDNGFIVYASTAVVISESESRILTCTEENGSIRISPVPAEIRSMAEDKRSEITSIVFAVGKPEDHRIIRIEAGTLKVSEEEGCITADTLPQAVQGGLLAGGTSGSVPGDDYTGVYESISLTLPAANGTQDVIFDEEEGRGKLTVKSEGFAIYSWNFYGVYSYEELIYKLSYQVDYDMQLYKTTDYVPSGLNDNNLYDEFTATSLDVEIPVPLYVEFNFSDYFIPLGCYDVPSYLTFHAASNNNLTALGTLKTEYSMSLFADCYFITASKKNMKTVSDIKNVDPASNETVFMIYDTLESFFDSGTDHYRQYLKLNAESGDCISIYKNDFEAFDAADETGANVTGGKLHFCGMTPMPNNYCISLAHKPYYEYQCKISVGKDLAGIGEGNTWWAGKTQYEYYSKAYDEKITGTDPFGKTDQCPYYGYRIHVTVFDKNGFPAVGANVTAVGNEVNPREERFRSAVTNENGEADIYVVSGLWTVKAADDEGGLIGSAQADNNGHPTSVVINGKSSYINRARIVLTIPQYTGEELSGRYDASVMAIAPSQFRLEYNAAEWKDESGKAVPYSEGTYGYDVQKAIYGPQYQEITLYAQTDWTHGLVKFADDLDVYAVDDDGVSKTNCSVVYVKVSEDGQSAKVLLRIDTFPKGTPHYSLTVGNGWGTGEYVPGTEVLIASYDCSEYGPNLGNELNEYLTQLILNNTPDNWSEEFWKWNVLRGNISSPDDFTPLKENKYSLCTITMPEENVIIESAYKPVVKEIDVSMPIPDGISKTLPQKDSGITLDTPDDAVLNCESSSWVNSDAGTISKSVYGDQYLTLEITAADENAEIPLKFSDELKIDITDTGSGTNEKYRLVGYTVSEDKKTATLLILVHVTRPGATEYYLTVNYGFMSGWYEEGTLVPIVSYDIPFVKDKLEDYLGKWADIIKALLPPSWQKSFSSWKVDAPDDGSVKFKDNFIPIVDKQGVTYAAAFFRMPSCDTEITAEYEGLKEIKEIVMDFDLPKPGSYMDYNAESSSEGVKSSIPLMDKLGWFPMMWTTIFRADYNESYTALIPVSPKDGYSFSWPLGLNTRAYVPYKTGIGKTEADHFFWAGNYALITHTYKTPKAQLLKTVNPSPIYFENGTPASEINEYLSSVKADILTEAGTEKAKVKWNTVTDTSTGDTGRFTYDSSLETRQEVYDSTENTYTLKGTVILPSGIRNEEEFGHAVTDQTVNINVIIKDKEGNELYPPIADPDSCESDSRIEVILKNPSDNPENAVIWYNNAAGQPTRYTSPIVLEKRERDTNYVIEAWTEHDGRVSPTASYVYTVRASEKYLLKVNGGTITDSTGEIVSQAALDAGTQVTIKANSPETYEHFESWTFKGLSASCSTAEYTFTMPENDVTATAVFVPNYDTDTIIDTVSVTIDEPAEGIPLAQRAKDSLYTAVHSAYYITAEPQPLIEWNADGYPLAEGGMNYTAAIQLRTDELWCGSKLNNAYFSEALTAKVNGQPAAVIADQSGKYATVIASFETPKETFTVKYDANGGTGAPEAQTKQRGIPLTITDIKPVRDGYVFLGWSSIKEGGVEYAPADTYEKDEDTILYAVWEKPEQILKIQAAFDVPDKEGDSLPLSKQITLSVLDPDGAPITLADAEWTDDFDLSIYTAETGDQYLHLHMKENNPYFSLSDKLEVCVKDTSAGGNDKVKVQNVKVSEDGKEADVLILVHISKPGAKEYYLTVDNGVGDGYYEEGDTAIVFSYDIKSISTVLKEIMPEYSTLIKLAEYFAEKLTGTFEKWEVIEPDDGTLEYKTDFWPVILKSGKLPKTTYAAAFFTMPAHDVELKAVYGSPETIDSVTMDFTTPRIGEKLPSLAVCTDPEKGVKPVPLMGDDGKFKIKWSGSDTVDYNSEYTSRVFVTADTGYKLKEYFNVVALDSYFPKGYDFDNGIQPAGHSEGSCLGFMDYAVLSYTYKTPKAQLLSIEQPNTVYFENGTSPEEINKYLEELSLVITSEKGQDKAKANWGKVADIAKTQSGRYTYDSRIAERQEVFDGESGTYTVKGTLKLPGSIRNTQTSLHDKVDQTVEITVVILEKDSTEILPPTAVPDSCESETALEIELINDERNPENTEIVYTLSEDGAEGGETVYSDKIYLAQRDSDTQYVIKAYARKTAPKNGGLLKAASDTGKDVSETVRFVYLIKAKAVPEYTVKVIGGYIDKNGERLEKAVFTPDEEVKITAVPDDRYERFGHWEFEGLTGTGAEETYTFTMPENNVTATAVFLPLADDDVIIESADIILDEPKAGTELADTVKASSCTDGEGSLLTSSPELAIDWNTGNHEKAKEGNKYTASMVISVSDLRLDGNPIPDTAVFSGAFRAKVNGKEARVIVDESRKYAVVEADFDLPITSFTVTYDANAADASNIPSAQTKNKGTALTLSETVPERKDYLFIGWGTEPDSGYAAYDPGDIYEQDEDITLYALWKHEYTVNASASEGGTVYPSVQTVAEGDSAVITFSPLIQSTTAWVLEKAVIYDSDPNDGTDVTDKVSGNTLKIDNVREDMNVYAFFKALPHTVKAQVVEGKGTVSPENTGVENGESVTFTLSPDIGFELNKSVLWVWENGSRIETDVTDKVSGNTLTLTDITRNTSVEIFYKEKEFTVTFDANGGTDAPAPQTKKYYSDLTLTESVPVREGFSFAGWSDDSGADEAQYAPGGLYTLNENVTLYAVWTKTYTVTAICTEGGSASPVSQTVLSGADAAVTFTPDTEQGVTWKLSKVTEFIGNDDDGIDVTEAVINNVLTISSVTDNIRLEAEFEAYPHTYTVTACVRSGKGTVTPEKITVKHGDDTAVTFTPDTEEGVTWKLCKVTEFIGNDDDGTDVTEAVINNVLTISSVTDNIRLEAEFEAYPHTYTVTACVRNGKGTVTPEKITVKHGADTAVEIVPDSAWVISRVTALYGTGETEDVTSRIKNGKLILENVTKDIRIEVEFSTVPTPDTSDPFNYGLWSITCAAALLFAVSIAVISGRSRKKQK